MHGNANVSAIQCAYILLAFREGNTLENFEGVASKVAYTGKIRKRLGPVFLPDWGLIDLYVYLLKALRFFQSGFKAGLLQ